MSGALFTITTMRDYILLVAAKVNEDNETQSRLYEHPNQCALHALHQTWHCTPFSKKFSTPILDKKKLFNLLESYQAFN